MQGTIITDCADPLARNRQEVRFRSLFGVQPTFLGVGSYSPVEAAGSLLDVLDVLHYFPLSKADGSVVLVNVAPRGEDIKRKWDNGTPFCWFRVHETLVVSTYDEQALALLRDIAGLQEVHVFDIPTVTSAAVQWGDLTQTQADKIVNTQFRSLEFLPLAAYWVQQGKDVPAETLSLNDLPKVDGLVWHIDSFGNAKITLQASDIDFAQGKELTLTDGKTATCYWRLAEVPKTATGITIGSSGYGEHRFLEVVVGHRGRAVDVHALVVGEPALRQTDKV